MIARDSGPSSHSAIFFMFAILLRCSVLGVVSPRGIRPPHRRMLAAEAYAPGLGEIMTLQQMRHTKLWLAGEAGNWDLAAYEIKELGEGFDDVVKFHPTHEESPGSSERCRPTDGDRAACGVACGRGQEI